MDRYQCLKLIGCQVFPPNCQKIISGHLTPPQDTPILLFSKNKNYLPNQMHSFVLRTKITWGVSYTPHDAPLMGGFGGHQTLPMTSPCYFLTIW